MEENELIVPDPEEVEVVETEYYDLQPVVLELQKIETKVDKAYTCLWLTSGFICYYIIRKISKSLLWKVGGGKRV